MTMWSTGYYRGCGFRPDAVARAELVRRTNPLLAAWLKYAEPYLFCGRFLRRSLDAGTFHDDVRAGSRAFAMRRRCTVRWAFAVPDAAALTTIARYGPILQIGAGTGYWACLLQRDYGVDILPVDKAPPAVGSKNAFLFTRQYVPIAYGTAATATQHPNRTLFLCWPPMGSMAADCLRRYGGQHVIYIGEGEGGCTADDAFHAALARDYDEIEDVDIPQWDGIHDRLTVHRRKVSARCPASRAGARAAGARGRR